MAINLELPRKLHAVIDKAHQGAAEMMRPIARKYDLKEHAYPIELDTLANLFEGAAESDPKPGSVMAIAAHTLPKRFNCSSVATPEIAALPRP